MNADNSSTRLPRATYASLVTERLRDSIIDRTLPPGSQLNEADLANRFGVSRGPIREALQRLIQEGLVRSEPHRGVFVPILSEEDVKDIYLAREALESAAVHRISETGKTSEAYAALDEHVRAMEAAEAAEEWDELVRHDLEFHTSLVAVTGSPRLQRMFSTVISETRLCLGVYTHTPERADLVAEHRRIAEAIRENDVTGALEVLKQGFVDAMVTLTKEQAANTPATEATG